MCKNVHVARPICSEPGGHSKGPLANEAPATPAAVKGFALDFVLVPAALEKDSNEVQALHGFPSGPITMPGGSLCPVFGGSVVIVEVK